jgi:hypothetical protein
MSAITGLSMEGVELIERDIPGVGLLRFENNPAGTWWTAKGDIAKRARRRYLLDGAELDSVSSIADTLSKPALLWWYETQGLIGGAQAALAGVLSGVPMEDWPDLCRLQGYGVASSDAAPRGTAIHVGMDTMSRTGEPPNALDYPEVWRPWLRGAVRAWLSLDPRRIESECVVCNPALGYAGRFDFYGYCHGRRTLVDWKSSAGGRVFDVSHYSTRGYAECFEVCGLEPPERIVICAFDDAGNFEPIDCEVSSEGWANLVKVYRERKGVNARMAAQRKAARKAAA